MKIIKTKIVPPQTVFGKKTIIHEINKEAIQTLRKQLGLVSDIANIKDYKKAKRLAEYQLALHYKTPFIISFINDIPYMIARNRILKLIDDNPAPHKNELYKLALDEEHYNSTLNEIYRFYVAEFSYYNPDYIIDGYNNKYYYKSGNNELNEEVEWT